ncbi:hypothetical protein M2226_006665 [Bradyrhizobium elkanii]|nr:hypothetical protein [Bradyrhizobium elkanii]MCW2127921.1 hypothetical protein [Bradyrhizobium elkanii]MCW2174664.1 hypothetical protein [Bradyrhizobium elkanii]
MPRPTLLALVIALDLLAPCKANDSTLPCNSLPEKGASVAVHAGTQSPVNKPVSD